MSSSNIRMCQQKALDNAQNFVKTQNLNNPNEFTYPYYGSMVYWAAKGYVVLDDASFPIIGEDMNEPNVRIV